MYKKKNNIVIIKLLVHVVLFYVVIIDFNVDAQFFSDRQSNFCSLRACRRESNHYVTNFFSGLVQDVVDLHKNLFSFDTCKVLAIAAPFYISTRLIDDRLQKCFFDEKLRKNRCQPPEWCQEVARLSFGIPMAFLGAQSLLSRDEQVRTTSQMMLTGFPFLWYVKDILKKSKCDANLRPHHETLSPHKRVCGGFPSGHIAGATYIAVLYGLQFGPKAAIPLGLLSTFIGSVFLSCNRHYASQLVAGAALGSIYALAVNKVINTKLYCCEDMSIGCDFSDQYGPAITVSWKF